MREYEQHEQFLSFIVGIISHNKTLHQ